MVILFIYIVCNLWIWCFIIVFIVGGMVFVIFVFVMVQMFDVGFMKMFVLIGELDNVVVICKGVEIEIQSLIDYQQVNVFEMYLVVVFGFDGWLFVLKEVVVLILFVKMLIGKLLNVVICGVLLVGFVLCLYVKFVVGCLFVFGLLEIVVGSVIVKGFSGMQFGDCLYFVQCDWIIVGIFDVGGSGFDLEIWGDVDQLMQLFWCISYLLMVLCILSVDGFVCFKVDIDVDLWLIDEVKCEQIFYGDQLKVLLIFINIFGIMLLMIFLIVVMIGVMIMMYVLVVNCVVEIGMLCVFGFKCISVFVVFLLEVLLFGFVGGVVGFVCVLLMQFVLFLMINFQIFLDLLFCFVLMFVIVVKMFVFLFVMGFVGGFLLVMCVVCLKIVDVLCVQ